MLFKYVLSQPILMVVATAYGVSKAAQSVSCTGNAQSCSNVTSGTSRLAAVAVAGVAVIYGLLTLVAYFASKKRNKVLTILIAIAEVLILLGSISIIATNNNGSDITGFVGVITSLVVLVLCIKNLKSSSPSLTT